MMPHPSIYFITTLHLDAYPTHYHKLSSSNVSLDARVIDINDCSAAKTSVMLRLRVGIYRCSTVRAYYMFAAAGPSSLS
jgi:hypothetical protein